MRLLLTDVVLTAQLLTFESTNTRGEDLSDEALRIIETCGESQLRTIVKGLALSLVSKILAQTSETEVRCFGCVNGTHRTGDGCTRRGG
jgi:hypothetical protein